MESLHKNIQFLTAPFLVLHFSQYTLITFLMTFPVIIAIYAVDNTLCFKYDQASDLWQQLQLPSELESDLRETVD